MFSLHEYIKQGVLGVLKRYVQDLDRRDAELSLWDGGLTLNNVVLRPDVLRHALRLPVTVTSGRIHQLRVQVPIKFIVEPVNVTINTMEIVLSLDREAPADVSPAPEDLPRDIETGQGSEEAPAGYIAGMVRKVVSNIKVSVNHLVLKLVDDDATLSLNIEELHLNSTDGNWEPAFIDVETSNTMRRRLKLKDLTLCLDRRDAAGNITRFQEPLLYRCNLIFKVTSVRTRPGVTNTRVDLECADLSLSISCVQLTMLHQLLIALLVARAAANARQEAAARARQPENVTCNAEEGEQGTGVTWSAWMWSWVPGGGGYDEVGVEGAAQAGGAARVLVFNIIVKKLTLSLKAPNRSVEHSHARCVLKLATEQAVLEMCTRDSALETYFGLNVGVRSVRLEAVGPCVCGHPSPLNEVYLLTEVPEQEVEEVSAAAEETAPPDEGSAAMSECCALTLSYCRRLHQSEHGERYGEASNLEEDCELVVHVRNVEITACAGAVHRVEPFIEAARVTQDSPPQALPERMPSGLLERVIRVVCHRPLVRLLSLQHTTQRLQPPVHLELEAGTIRVNVNEPLYPLRIPGSRLQRNVMTEVDDLQLMLTDAPAFPEPEQISQDTPAPVESRRPNRKQVARLSLECNLTQNLHTNLHDREVTHYISMKIREVGTCVSAARLRAVSLLASAAAGAGPPPPVVAPQLALDALADHNAVHVDILMENMKFIMYYTDYAQLYTLKIRSIRATLLQGLPGQEQAFLFMSPTTPNVEGVAGKLFVDAMLLRVGVRRCITLRCHEPSASLDPMLVSWLAGWRIACDMRTPDVAPPSVHSSHMSVSASTSSGRHSLLHRRADALSRSHSSDEREPTPSVAHPPPAPKEDWRQRAIDIILNVCISVHVFEITLYAPMETVSALDCSTLPAAMERHTCTPQYSAQSSPIIVICVDELTLLSPSDVEMLRSLRSLEYGIMEFGIIDLQIVPELRAMPWMLAIRQLRCIMMPPGVAEGSARSHKRPKLVSSPITFLKPHTTTVAFTVQNHNVSPRTDSDKQGTGKPNFDYWTTTTIRIRSSLTVFINSYEVEVEVRFNQVLSIYRAGHLLCHILEAVVPARAARARTPTPAATPAPAPPTTSSGAASAVSHSSELLRRASTSASPSSANSDQAMPVEVPEPAHRVHTVVSVQWMMQQATLQYFSHHDSRLNLTIEGLDVSGNYFVESIHYEMNISDAKLSVQSKQNEWRLSTSPGARVLRPLADPPEPKLIDVDITITTNTYMRHQMATVGCPRNRPADRAHGSHVVHRQYREVLLVESVVSIAPLELTLSPTLLAPFVRSFITAVHNARALCCEPRTPDPPRITTTRRLVHVECKKVILQLPAESLQEGNAEFNTVVVQLGDIYIRPHPDNPIARQPLCQDVLMEVDQTAEWYDNPQDIQHIIKVLAFSVHTSTWAQLQRGRAAMAAAQNNAALAWARWGEALGPTPLLPHFLIHLTLAPATTIYAAAAELSTTEDVNVHVCMPQLRLLIALNREMAATVTRLMKRNQVTETDKRCQYRATVNAASPEPARIAAPESADTIGIRGNSEIYATVQSVNITLYEESQQHGVVNVRITQPSLFLTCNDIASTTNYQASVYDLSVALLDKPELRTDGEASGSGSDSAPAAKQNTSILMYPILETMRGEPHHATQVPFALCTVNAKPVNTDEGRRFEVGVSMERPVRLILCEERARQASRLRCILKDVLRDIEMEATDEDENPKLVPKIHNMFNDVLQSVEITTRQLVVQLASAGTMDCDSVSCGLSTLEACLVRHIAPQHARGERGLHLRALVGGLAVSVPPANCDNTQRSYLLHPVTFGVNARVVWTAPPTGYVRGQQLRLLVDAGRVTLEVAPHLPAVLSDATRRMRDIGHIAFPPDSRVGTPTSDKDVLENVPSCLAEACYEDDMSSKPPIGAFRIVHLVRHFPSPFQMAVGADSVTWCYPIPRVITSLVIHALDKYGAMLADVVASGVPLTLEWYCQASEQFQLVCSFVLEELCSHLFAPPPLHEICAKIWRVRITKSEELEENPLDSAPRPFVPAAYSLNPPSVPVDLAVEEHAVMRLVANSLHIKSRQKASEVPTTSLVARATTLKLHVRMSPNPESTVEALTTARAALSIHAEHSPVLHVRHTPTTTHIATQFRAHAYLLDPYTMKLERMLGPSLVRVRCQRGEVQQVPVHTLRAYVHNLDVTVSPHHLRLIRKLQRQWAQAEHDTQQEEREDRMWVRYIIANNTERVLHIGQKQRTNLLELSPGEQRPFDWRNSAYRLRGEQAPHTLCVSLPNRRTCAEVDLDEEGSTKQSMGSEGGDVMYMYIRNLVDQCGTMMVRMEGLLHLANMTSYDLVYEIWKVKPVKNDYSGLLCVGVLPALSTDRTALCCKMDQDLLLIRYRLKRETNQLCWTGCVPLGARTVPGQPELSRARGTPWLTKLEVDSGRSTFAWNRTVCEPTSDSRLLVMLWPIYLVTSELPLDVLATAVRADSPRESQELSVPGRGATTLFPLSGTPSTLYNCTFRYRDVEAPLTQELVPLHYGLNRQPQHTTPTADIETLLGELKTWVAKLRNDQSEQDEEEDYSPVWPYSVVTQHITCEWRPSPLPPHTDINIEYKQVRTKSDGSGFELALKPQSLFCNATERTLTVRTADVVLFTVEPGHVVAPPAAFPQVRGWMVSICEGEEGTERWVSCEVSVVDKARGPYERVPDGELTLHRPAHLHIISIDSTELVELSLFFDMYKNMEIVGASTALVLRNTTPDVLLVSGVAVWVECNDNLNDSAFDHELLPRDFRPLPPHDDGSCDGTLFDLFTIQQRDKKQTRSNYGHWRLFLCFALHYPNVDKEVKHVDFVPMRYNKSQDHRTLALRTADGAYQGYCATVQQLQPQDKGRWLVEIGKECHAQYRVKNKTKHALMLASTLAMRGETQLMRVVECEGAEWERRLPAGADLLYSSPAHSEWCVNADPDVPPPKHRLVLSSPVLEGDDGIGYEEWMPVDVSGMSGDAQLVRLTRDVHVKVFVRRGSRETRVTICHIESHDMSARDIRERLANFPVASTSSVEVLNENVAAGPQPPDFPAPNTDPQEETHKWDVGVFVASTKLTFQEPYGGHRNMLHFYLDDATVTVRANDTAMNVTANVRSIQADNAQRTESNVAYDFPVVLMGEGEEIAETHPVPPMWTVQLPEIDHTEERLYFDVTLLFCRHNQQTHTELYKLEARCPRDMKLYVEDKYLTTLLNYLELVRAPRRVAPARAGAALLPHHALVLSEQLRHPLSMQNLQLHEMELDLNLRSTQWLYLALNKSPVKLNAFQREEFSTRPARLSRTLIHHYLSGAVLRAGWMIGSLELLGAPGTLVRRVGEAVRGGGALQLCGQVAAGTLDSVSTLCSSLARNLDLLTGDEHYAILAAEQRRQRPRSLPHALVTGITGFVGATFGGLTNLVQLPLAAPRTALLGVIAKPLSAAADLVSMSSQGLLNQAGWEAHPQPRTWVPQLTEHAGPMEMTVLSDGRLVIQEHIARYADASTLVLVTSQCIVLLNERNEMTHNMELNQIMVDAPRSPPDRIVRLRPMIKQPRPMPPQPRSHWDHDAESVDAEVEARQSSSTERLLNRRDAVMEVIQAARQHRACNLHLDSDEAELELRTLLASLSRGEATGFTIL